MNKSYLRHFWPAAPQLRRYVGGRIRITPKAMRIGITQNNVGVDSYQTTYDKAFIAAAEANADVDVVRVWTRAAMSRARSRKWKT